MAALRQSCYQYLSSRVEGVYARPIYAADGAVDPADHRVRQYALSHDAV